MLTKSSFYLWLFLKLYDLYFQFCFFYTLNNMITLCLYNTDIFTCLLITSYRPKYLRIISSFFLKSFGEKRLVQSVKLLPLKAINK